MNVEQKITANEAARALQKLIEGQRLVIEPRAIPIFARCMMVDYERFSVKVESLCRDENTQIHLYPDGMPDELSFGILWFNRPEAFRYADGRVFYADVQFGDHIPFEKRQKPFMVGGLIYRGPERGDHYQNQPHEWTSHT